MLHQRGLKFYLLLSYGRWKEMTLKETRRLNTIILTEEINQLHTNGVLTVFSGRSDNFK